MLEIKNLNKYYKAHHALKDINISVVEGSVVAIIGPSGSGKSTLLRCVNLLEKPSSGEIHLGEIKVDAESIPKKILGQIQKSTAMVFQNYNLFANKTALENIMEALVVVKKMNKKEAETLSRKLLENVGLGEKGDQYPSTLSGGQQQRVAIARALALNPKIMLFDEPTSALDPELVGEVLSVIKSVARKKITSLIVTHELEFAREVADEIIFMENGKIVEKNNTKDFFNHPKEKRTKEFLEVFHNKFIYEI